MNPLRRWVVWLAAVTVAGVAFAQPVAPRIGYVYPAGAQHGTTIDVNVGGQGLDGVAQVYVSGQGVQAEVKEHAKPMTQQQANALKEKLQALQEKKPKDSATLKEIVEVRKQLAMFVRRPANPAIAETVTLRVTVAQDADLGQREVRLGTPRGLTNPMVFEVGPLPEFSKHVKQQEGQGPQGFRSPNAAKAVPATEMTVTLPATVNGQILQGGVDRYRFEARKGQRLVVAVSARELIPYLADAVPGWFQATLALYDAHGKELAYDDDYRFHPDPVILCTIPKDGQYKVEIKDAIYRGREDFVYRITLGELPFVTSIFPLGGKAGDRTSVEIKGWNLPETALTQDNTDRAPGLYSLCVDRDGQVSNSVPFAVDTLPEFMEKESNNSQDSAQRITPVVTLNGRIGQPGDSDVFCFDGRGGDEIVAEVYARRLDSPLDSALKLTDSAGRTLAYNDDREDKGAGLTTHHADSQVRVTLPSNGTYYVHLGDAQHKGGPEYGYRLRISPPRPDYELRVTPSSITARGGTPVLLTVYALRKDGFAGEIALGLKDSPAGFLLSGARVPANQDLVRLTLTVPQAGLAEPMSLSLEGHATILGKEVRRQAVPAEDMMQAFAYRHLVPTDALMVSTAGLGKGRSPLRLADPGPLKVPAGGSAEVRIIALRGWAPQDKIQLEPSDPPAGIAVGKVSSYRDGAIIEISADAAKAKPGLAGNLIVNAILDRSQVPADPKAKANQRRVPLALLPAIPFEVVEPSKDLGAETRPAAKPLSTADAGGYTKKKRKQQPQ